MTHKFPHLIRKSLIAAAIGSSCVAGISDAAALYWDGGVVAVNGVSNGGSGPWQVGVGGWEDGTSVQNWANGNTAVLGGSAGTLTLGGAISAAGISVQSPGYQISGNHALAAGAIEIAGGASLEINNGTNALSWSGLAGNGGLTIHRAGQVNLIDTFNTANALAFHGNLVLRGGTATTVPGTVSGATTIFGGAGLTQAPDTSFALDTGSANNNARDLILTDAFNAATLSLNELKGFGSIRTDVGASGTRTLRVHQATTTQFDGLMMAHRTSTTIHRQLVFEKAGAGMLTLTGYLGHQSSGAGTNVGSLSVVVDGGTLVMTADSNDYIGSTTVNAGTLRIGNGGTTGNIGSSGAGADGNRVTVASGATLEFRRSGTLSYAASGDARMRHLSGDGDVVLRGGLTMVSAAGTGTGFAEPNSWSGFDGRLVVLDGSEFRARRNGATAMGTAQIVLGDETTSGKLAQHTDNCVFTNDIQLVGPANEILNRVTGSNRWNKYQGEISGSGAVSFSSPAVGMNNGDFGFILTGANTMSGTVTADTFLRVGGVPGESASTDAGTGGTLGTAEVVINPLGRLTFSRSNAHTVGNVISGGGGLHIGSLGISGSNTQDVTLSGVNTYSGGTEHLQGTLRVHQLSGIGTGYLAVKHGSTFVYQGSGSETTTRTMWLDQGPATIEISQPTAVLTWNPGAGLRTQLLTKTGPGTFVFGGAITNTNGSVMVTDGKLTLTAANTYDAATTVAGGTLEVTGSLGNTAVTVQSGGTLAGNGNVAGNVTIAAGGTQRLAVAATPGAQITRTIGGVLDLDADGDILTLTAASIPAPGTYTLVSATGGILGEPESMVLIGVSGTVEIVGNTVVLTADGGGDPFASWALANGLDGSAGKENGFDDDPDGDGVANGLEWILGGSPLDGGSGALTSASATAADGLTFSFERNPVTVGAVELMLEYNTDLGPVWESVAIGAASSSEANGVEIEIETGPDPHEVSVSIPASNAGPDKRIFARLKATRL
jgi:autotransporter-associated beta strand protein